MTTGSDPIAETCCPIVELRQYTLHPGKRDVLIDLFDREFVEPQEALGMKVIGQFRDLERPDCFVRLRGFSDMPSRKQMLADFYGGPEEGEMGSGRNGVRSGRNGVRSSLSTFAKEGH